MIDDRTDIARRVAAGLALSQNRDSTLATVDPGELIEDPLAPRWRIDSRFIEFECGCRAERCRTLIDAKPWDPVIFRDLPQQAVYDYVCERHHAGMNTIVHFGKFIDFSQWKKARRLLIMGRLKA